MVVTAPGVIASASEAILKAKTIDGLLRRWRSSQ
jgi:hypothetical protein